MAESVTISRTPPDFKSMQYDFLREEGLKHIQRLAGNIWTDYNLSDPGVSMLEVLSYVITDLGYRTNYPIKDILAQDPDAPQTDIKNFYTARQILPMRPVTYNDYRKLLIDTDVHDPSDVGAEFVGVKNAWIEITDENEFPVYVQQALDKLDYKPEVTRDPKVDMKVLYNVLLELDKCEKFGDLNENILEGIAISPALPGNPKLAGLKIKVKVEFPRWDDEGVDWDDLASIRSHIKNLTLIFSKVPQGYKVEGYGLFPDKSPWVSVVNSPGGPSINTGLMELAIYDLIYTGASSLILLYQQKVKKILEIICAVRKKIMDNRNLCEDLLKISALKIEEIAVCADVELATNADVEETLAKIYFDIANFLAPTVYFYTLEEMYDKGKRTEEIFEGPALNHGFIDTDELLKAERRKMIHVSDLIQIIMDVPGVIAVKSIHIANVPEDNDDNIPSVSVKWCLDLAFEFNYVPRLSTELSKITFFKELLPYKANDEEVDKLIAEMEAAARPQKIEGDVELDIPVPEGEFKAIEEYVSTQDEFPLVYGTGPEGLPETATTLRKAQQKQLKGFLMFFDQLLADYLSQLAHVKDLFSMNEERDAFGDFVIDKSYFTQSLVPSVTDANDLLADPVFYAENVQEMTEDLSLFELRRNKFLDHLMARFSEQFTDYALIEYKIDGKKAPKELLEDKLEVLNAYPEISSGRFRAFNYEKCCELWSVNNESGFERRSSLLAGVDPRTPNDLYFTPGIVMTGTEPALGYEIDIVFPFDQLLKNPMGRSYATVNEWKLAMEDLVMNGIERERYFIYDKNGVEIGPDNLPTPMNEPFSFMLFCNSGCTGKGELLGVSVNTYLIYPDPMAPLKNVEKAIQRTINVFSEEFYNNPESNRNNLSCPIRNYIEVIPATPYPDMVPDPPTYTFDFNLYKEPFDFASPFNTKLMTGSYTGKGEPKASETILSVLSPNSIRINGDYIANGKINPGDAVSIRNSDTNDGDYTVVSMALSGSDTDLTLSRSPLPPAFTASVPLGSLMYNTQTVAQLTAIADAATNPALFDIMFNGSLETHYSYDDLSGDYRFNITDRCGDTLATSVEKNFNDSVAAFCASHPSVSGSRLLPPLAAGSVRIEDSVLPTNNGDYPVIPFPNTEANNADVIVNVTGSLNTSTGAKMIFDGSINVISANRFTKTFVVAGALNRFLFPGETIVIYNSPLNQGSYTIKNITLNGPNSEIHVEEKIHTDTGLLGYVYYLKNYEVVGIIPLGTTTDLVIRPGAEFVASREVMEFIRLKFFGHEGMHIVEHILLRPKVNQDILVPMIKGINSLKKGLSPEGNVELTKTFPISYVDGSTNTFWFTQNFSTDIMPMMFIRVKGSVAGINDKTYQVASVGTTGTDTMIKVLGSIPDDTLPPLGQGSIYFEKIFPINPGGTDDLSVTITGTIAGEIDANGFAKITGSQDGLNDHSYKVSGVTSGIGDTTITFSEVYTHFQDALLPINLKDDCINCRIEDPYSFIASVVLPYWQGRFINQDFRGFFERLLRTECPAHIALNICWVNNEQMEEFEKKYKTWLMENCREVKDPILLSAALNELIDILGRLRTIYPGGTLHDCEAEETLANSVILNRTALGTIQI